MKLLPALSVRSLVAFAFALTLAGVTAKPKQPKSPPPPPHPAAPATPPPVLPSGTAQGTFTRKIERGLLGSLPFVSRNKPKSQSVTLTYAGAFVDQKDNRKPTLLVLADAKLPAENWKSEADLKRALGNFNGVVFWLDKEGKVFRMDTCWDGRSKSTSGVFELQLASTGEGKDLTGSAKTVDPAELEQLKVRFHAAVR